MPSLLTEEKYFIVRTNADIIIWSWKKHCDHGETLLLWSGINVSVIEYLGLLYE